ncbi:MAG: aminoacyl-tRNA hydrolase [Alphaproteobacteria bacterium]|nr:aminoacyl-tRNA hydrolase [Alphaproteobacteria bacterium]MBF0250611.1 aminoacyl-tRNA hydrolase [Alphaproteobacteria bacterium]
MLDVTPTLSIADDELVEAFVRSPGAGGQNVNTVATAVQLRFDAAGSEEISAPMFLRLKRLAGRRMTADGVVVIEAHAHRTQAANRRDARARLADLLRAAAVEPRTRRPTKPSRAAKQKRVEQKKRTGALKAARARVRFAD